MNHHQGNQLLAEIKRAARRPDQAVRYVTIWQGIVCGAANDADEAHEGGAFINVQARLDRVEYQNQISIQDRADLRTRVPLLQPPPDSSRCKLRQARHVHVQVDAVQQGTRNLLLVLADHGGRAGALPVGISVVAADARVHAGHQDEAGGVDQARLHARHVHNPVLQRLPQDLQHVPLELRQLIQEEHVLANVPRGRQKNDNLVGCRSRGARRRQRRRYASSSGGVTLSRTRTEGPHPDLIASGEISILQSWYAYSSPGWRSM